MFKFVCFLENNMGLIFCGHMMSQKSMQNYPACIALIRLLQILDGILQDNLIFQTVHV